MKHQLKPSQGESSELRSRARPTHCAKSCFYSSNYLTEEEKYADAQETCVSVRTKSSASLQLLTPVTPINTHSSCSASAVYSGSFLRRVCVCLCTLFPCLSPAPQPFDLWVTVRRFQTPYPAYLRLASVQYLHMW